MRLEDFDYSLPKDLIAQRPARHRADSRMLVVYRREGRWEDALFRQLPDFLEACDVLALNNSRVVAARLFGRRVGVRAQAIGKRNPARAEYLTSCIEVLLARRLDERTWEALVKPGRKVRPGEVLKFDSSDAPENAASDGRDGKSLMLEAEVIGRGDFGLRVLRFPEGVDLPEGISLDEMLEKVGHVPVPPYIHRPKEKDEKQDRLRYQTVYAKHPGSVAAPTAGLHFTKEILYELEKRGVERAEITLHVGLGTFQPIHVTEIEKHRMHPETFEVDALTAARLSRALEQKRRIVAVGTTTVRTLEHLAQENNELIGPGRGETRLFIVPGFKFRVIGGLLTNFHLPRTTLLMLVSAFAGRELILDAYRHAVRERYRFYSYGDCMLIL